MVLYITQHREQEDRVFVGNSLDCDSLLRVLLTGPNPPDIDTVVCSDSARAQLVPLLRLPRFQQELDLLSMAYAPSPNEAVP